MNDRVTPRSLKHIAAEYGLDYKQLWKMSAEEYDREHGQGAHEIALRNSLKEQGIQFDSDGVEIAAEPVQAPPAEIEYPPGVAGTAARWLAAGNLSPNPMASIASVLITPAAICGRAWTNGSPQRDDGLNLYICLLAPSGSGKEWMWGGLRTMLSIAGLRGRAGVIGARPASGTALSEMLEESPCTVIPLQEMGKWLQRILGRGANGADISLQGDILALYNESGESDVHVGTAKAGKNGTRPVLAPCMSILGDSTHSSLWRALSDDSARSGLLSRLVVLDAGETRPRPLATAHLAPCPHEVRIALESLAGQRNDAIVEDPFGRRRIPWSPEAVRESSERFEEWADQYCSADEFGALLTSRNRQNAPRIAGNLALFNNPLDPEVTAADIAYAWRLVSMGSRRMVQAYHGGDIMDARVDLDAVVLAYAREKAKDACITRNQIRAWAVKSPAFAAIPSERVSQAVDGVLKSLEESGYMAELPHEDRKSRGIRGRGYIVSM